jgi:hypothetical protein
MYRLDVLMGEEVVESKMFVSMEEWREYSKEVEEVGFDWVVVDDDELLKVDLDRLDEWVKELKGE